MKQNQLSIFNTDANDSLLFDNTDIEVSAGQSNSEAKHLREKATIYGIKKLIPEEILSLLTGIEIAKCREYINLYNFSEIVKFVDMLNISSLQKMRLSLLYEFCINANTDIRKEKPFIDSSIKAGEYFVKMLKFERNEKFIMACLDSRNRLITTITLVEGSINEARVYMREVIRAAIGSNACSIMACHNHPGESMHPSPADIDLTKRLRDAVNVVSINLLDHIIVAGDKYFSMAENGILV